MSAAPASASPPSAPRVTLLERFPLQCADAASLQRVESPMRLGPMDQTMLPFIPIAVLFVYRDAQPEPPAAGGEQQAAGAAGELIPVERLRRALSRLLDYYPHLTGRIAINAQDGSPEVDWLGAGAALLSVQCDAPLDAFCASHVDTAAADPDAPSSPRLDLLQLPGAGGNALLAPFDASMEGVCRDPVLTVQHTRFACGGVALGVRVLHLLCDADGYLQLVHDMAEIYRALRAADLQRAPVDASTVALRRPPHIQSYMQELHLMSAEERAAALHFKPSVYRLDEEPPAPAPAPVLAADAPPSELATSAATDTQGSNVAGAAQDAEAALPAAAPAVTSVSASPVTGRVLRFSSRTLAALKAEANAGRTDAATAAAPSSSDGSASPAPLSTFDALSAHLWQSVYRARLRVCELHGMSPAQAALQTSCEYLTSVNWRAPSRLDLPPRYFPNAVFAPFFALPAEQLGGAPLGVVARAVHDAVRAKPADRQEALHSLRWIAAQPDKRRVRLGFRYELGGFLVSQWNKFDLYLGSELDSRPALVAPPFTPISLVDGLAYFLPTEEQRQGREPEGAAASTGGIDVHMALSEPLWAVLEQDERFQCDRQQPGHMHSSQGRSRVASR